MKFVILYVLALALGFGILSYISSSKIDATKAFSVAGADPS